MKAIIPSILAAVAALSVSSCSPDQRAAQPPDFNDLARVAYPAPRQGVDDVAETLNRLDGALASLEREASEDSRLMELIRRYRAGAKSAETLRAELAGLAGIEVDVYGMVHDSFGADVGFVAACQGAVVKFVSAYPIFWTEDHTGGGFLTKTAAIDEMLLELSVNPLSPYGANPPRSAAESFYEENLHVYASHALIGETMVYGGDYRPLKAIHQHLLCYGDLFGVGRPLPSDLTPKTSEAARDALSAARDLYLLSYVAAKKASGRQVIVFGLAHLPHLARLLGDYGALGEAVMPRSFLQDSRVLELAGRYGVKFL
jgi:hypothetical protein